MAGLTPFQTVGPFLHLGFRAGVETEVTSPDAAVITIVGSVTDGRGNGVPDGVLECWWQDAEGREPMHSGRFLRAFTTTDGAYSLKVSRPVRIEGPGSRLQSPHIAVFVLARGILTRCATRIYFGDDPSLDQDAILKLVPRARRSTLIAAAVGPAGYRHDIVLQGDSETVFFDV